MTSTHKLARRDGRSTSFQAAHERSKRRQWILYEAIFQMLTNYGSMSDDQIILNLSEQFPPSSVRSRRNELVLAGWVTELRDVHGAVVRRNSKAGMPCTVWRAVAPHEDHTPPAPTRANTGPRLGDVDADEHHKGAAAAKRAAEWRLGYGYLADMVINAYLNPDKVNAELDEEGAP